MDINKNNNLDSVTRSYINGEITFQQYEALVEDYHIQNGIIAAATSLSNKLDANTSSVPASAPIYISSEVEILNQSSEHNISSSCSDLSTLTPFSYTSSKRKERKRTNSNNSLSKQTHLHPLPTPSMKTPTHLALKICSAASPTSPRSKTRSTGHLPTHLIPSSMTLPNLCEVNNG